MSQRSKGYFITVEGIDGSGTTTVARALSHNFSDSILTEEPSPLWTGESLRRALEKDSQSPALADLFLFLADRAYHTKEFIRPELDAGNIVISDRYHDSTKAYQTVMVAEEMEYIASPKTITSGFLPSTDSWTEYPNLTILLDVDAETALERNNNTEKYEENKERLERVRDRYLQLANEDPDRFIVLDASKPENEVINTAVGVAQAKYQEHLLKESDRIIDRPL